MIEPIAYHFDDDSRFPNSPLPLLIYPGALPPDPARIEQLFAAHNWSNAWRNGIYMFHHFHSIAHEVLGVAAGEVLVRFGGPSGQDLRLRAGDAAVIPAGVAHCNKGQSPDFLIVGAYPAGCAWDVRRGLPSEHARAKQAITAVATPAEDPLTGLPGPLRNVWRIRTDG